MEFTAERNENVRFDNSELIRLKQKCDELNRLTARREDCLRYLKGLSEKQPALMEKLMKETGERDTMSRKMSSSSVYSWFNKKQFMKEMEEAEEAERVYAATGAEYERVIRELEKADAAIEERKNAKEEYSDCYIRIAGHLKASPGPEAARMREIADETKLIGEQKKAIEEATSYCSEAIRTAAALAEPIPKVLSALSFFDSGYRNRLLGIAELVRSALMRYEEGLRQNVKDLVFVLRRSKLSFGAEELPAIEENLRNALESFGRECGNTKANQPVRTRNAVSELKRYSDEIGTRLLQISADMREGATDCDRRVAELANEEEELLLSEIDIPEKKIIPHPPTEETTEE